MRVMRTLSMKISPRETRVKGPITKEKTMIKEYNPPRIAVSELVTEAEHINSSRELRTSELVDITSQTLPTNVL